MLRKLSLLALLASSVVWSASSINGNDGVVIVDGVSNVPISSSNPLTITGTITSGLPTGASTAAKQDTGNTSLSSIDGKTPALVSGRQPVDGSGVTQPVSAASLPLPSGASTSALQGSTNTKLDTINTTLGTPLQAGGSVVVTSAPTTAVTGTFWQATQPVSGTVTITPSGTQTVSGTVAATQSGTWTVQPGNTANTTPHLATVTPVVSPLSSSSPTETTTSAAYEASHIVKGSAGVLYALICYNSKSSSQFVLTYNSTTLPADATASVTAPMSCNATSNCTLDFGQYGKYYSTGIVWSNSSTSPTKTIGSADMFCEPRYQ